MGNSSCARMSLWSLLLLNAFRRYERNYKNPYECFYLRTNSFGFTNVYGEAVIACTSQWRVSVSNIKTNEVSRELFMNTNRFSYLSNVFQVENISLYNFEIMYTMFM